MTERRRKAEARGRHAEWMALLYLSMKGWRILRRRARTAAGEIDLIVKRGNVLAFVEVKHRTSHEKGLHALQPRQTARLLRAGALWRAQSAAYGHLQPRFDFIVITPWRWPTHIKGAFEADTLHAQNLV